jgi:hypothetical protein
MNALEYQLKASGMNETWAMNLLQAHGIISDNCATAAEVAPPDCFAAIRFLMRHQPLGFLLE